MPKIQSKKSRAKSKQAGYKEAILESLRETPIIQYACKRANIGRTTFYRLCESDPEFTKAVDVAITEGAGMVNDLAEAQIISLIKDQNFPASSFWLKHRHPAYTTKIQVETVKPKPELTPEHLAIIEKALGSGTPVTNQSEHHHEKEN